MEALVPVFSETFGIEDYRRLLERFYGFYSAFEQAVASTWRPESMLADWPERQKLQLLAADLVALGSPESSLQTLAVCPFVPPVHTEGLLFGALYVTEGSTLGGQIICRQIGRTLGVLPGKGASFFNGHGEQTSARWKSFISALSQVSTPATESQIVRSAVTTFESMASWLSQSPIAKDTCH